MSRVVEITKQEAIDAVTAQAFHVVEEDRVIVHSVTVGGAFLLGADWDLADVISEIERCAEVGWIDDFMGHELALVTTGGRAYKFDVTRPAAVPDTEGHHS